jgi:phage gpG-like protein
MIEVTTDTRAFDSSLRALQQRLGNLRPVLQDIGAVLENRIKDRRETLTDPAGQTWAAWAASTLASYPPGGRRKLLDRTGAMWDRTGPQWKVQGGLLSDLLLRVGFDKGYATYHEFGTQRMPRRGLLFAEPEKGELGAADEQAIEDVLQGWLDAVDG